jgi:hypothetical protein
MCYVWGYCFGGFWDTISVYLVAIGACVTLVPIYHWWDTRWKRRKQ